MKFQPHLPLRVCLSYRCLLFSIQGLYLDIYIKQVNVNNNNKWLKGIALFKNVNNCLSSNIYSYLETSGGQSSNLFSFLTPMLIRHLW